MINLSSKEQQDIHGEKVTEMAAECVGWEGGGVKSECVSPGLDTWVNGDCTRERKWCADFKTPGRASSLPEASQFLPGSPVTKVSHCWDASSPTQKKLSTMLRNSLSLSIPVTRNHFQWLFIFCWVAFCLMVNIMAKPVLSLTTWAATVLTMQKICVTKAYHWLKLNPNEKE